MPCMRGKQAFLDLLKQEGVDLIFGNPGTTELPLMDALAGREDMRYVLGLQEAAVMAMADGFAQASGKLAVVNLHVAPGLGNAMGMLYDAQKAASPVLVTAGQHDQRFSATEPILWADLPTVARPFVKWAGEVRRLADLPRLVHRAATTALARPSGPVFLSLPGDILNAEGDLDLGAPTRVAPRVRADREGIERAAAVLASAERPAIIAGDVVAQNDAHAELVELAELLGTPVYPEAVASTASFPASHPLFQGALVRTAAAIHRALEQYDVLFSVGGDLFTMSLPADLEPLPRELRVIHLDTDAWELGKNYPAEVALFGDPKTTLPELTAALRERMTDGDRARAAARREAVSQASVAEREALKAHAGADAETIPVQPRALLNAIDDTLPDDAVVVEEALSSGVGVRRFLRSDDPQSFYGLRGGGIGWGLPASIGVKLALPDRPVVALVGDGSAMYTIQALWTAAHERVATVFVILNNSSYRILKQRTSVMGGSVPPGGQQVGMDMTDPCIEFVTLARSLGVPADRAETVAEATDLLAAGLESDGPRVVEVVVDRTVKQA